MITVSRHASERMLGRLRLPTHCHRLAARDAFLHGMPHPSMTGEVREWLRTARIEHGDGTASFRYRHGAVWVFDGVFLITVMFLPDHLEGSARVQSKAWRRRLDKGLHSGADSP